MKDKGKAQSKSDAALTSDTLWLVDKLFKPQHRIDAARMLEKQCSRNLPFCENAKPAELERLHFAALKVSRGDLKRLSHAIHEAQMDWRDLLMAADFGLTVNAHREWLDELRSDK